MSKFQASQSLRRLDILSSRERREQAMTTILVSIACRQCRRVLNYLQGQFSDWYPGTRSIRGWRPAADARSGATGRGTCAPRCRARRVRRSEHTAWCRPRANPVAIRKNPMPSTLAASVCARAPRAMRAGPLCGMGRAAGVSPPVDSGRRLIQGAGGLEGRPQASI
jgi:hypothetical protein